MKNQYFGDVNDYRKFGLLRALQKPGNLSPAVGWMLTPDDGSSDGELRHYLREPSKWRRYDEPLFDRLSAALSDGATPSVAMIERSSILPRARFFSEVVPDERSARALWGERLVEFAAGADLVFLDPDNGFEIPSNPIGRKDSSKRSAATGRFWNRPFPRPAGMERAGRRRGGCRVVRSHRGLRSCDGHARAVLCIVQSAVLGGRHAAAQAR